MGFATILPEKDVKSMPERVQEDQYKRAMLTSKQKDTRAEDLASIKAFDTYRYYLPVTNQLVENLVDYVRKPDYSSSEFQLMKAKATQLSQAAMQLKDTDDLAFKEYDDNPIYNDDVKTGYVEKYRSNATVEGLEQAAKTVPDKYWFLKEVGGSRFINEGEAFRAAIDKEFQDWLMTSEEGMNFQRQRFGNAINQFSSDFEKQKLKAFAKYDEATGRIVSKDADELIEAGVLVAFQQNPNTNRLIEDKSIEYMKNQGIEGPVTDEIRAEVLKSYLDPRAGVGQIEKGTKRTTASDFIPASQAQGRETKTTATKWLDSALTGDRNAWDFIKGSQYEGKTVIESEVSPDGTEVTIRLGDPVKEYMEGAQEVFLPTADGSGVETRFVMPSVTRTIDLTDRNRWTDEALLELYRGTVSTSQRPSFGEVRATVKPEKKIRKFDNF